MENTENEQKLFAEEKTAGASEEQTAEAVEAGKGGMTEASVKPEKRDLYTPFAVIIAGALIAGSIYATGGVKIINGNGGNQANVAAEEEKPREIVIKPVTADDHYVGKLSAPVAIVTYTDLECPFCKRFHETMGKIMGEYRDAGKVVWVYRHFPLDQLHSKARKEAEAAECASLLGGNIKFWEYTNKIFASTGSNNSLDLALLPKFAGDIGLDRGNFELCLNNGRTKDIVQQNLEDGISAGAQGTPYSVVLTKSGEKFAIDGAYPYELVKQIIDKVLEGAK